MLTTQQTCGCSAWRSLTYTRHTSRNSADAEGCRLHVPEHHTQALSLSHYASLADICYEISTINISNCAGMYAVQ